MKVYREEGKWTDFGEKNTIDGHKYDGGDYIELKCRIEGKSRSEVLREFGRRFHREAYRAIVDAGMHGQPMPEWIEQYATITEYGWQLYRLQFKRKK